VPKISVAVPVGPEPHHAWYLEEAVLSARGADEVLIIDDMHGLPDGYLGARVWHAPWRLGVGAAFNAGVALAANELVFMLGADDRLLDGCLEQCVRSYEQNKRDGYYWVGVAYSDGRPDQFEPCNAAMVTKGLWRATGGFPPETGSGAPDCALISVLMRHMPKALICVNHTEPLYWYRWHPDTDTASRAPWQGVILETRDKLAELWRPPRWGRYT